MSAIVWYIIWKVYRVIYVSWYLYTKILPLCKFHRPFLRPIKQSSLDDPWQFISIAYQRLQDVQLWGLKWIMSDFVRFDIHKIVRYIVSAFSIWLYHNIYHKLYNISCYSMQPFLLKNIATDIKWDLTVTALMGMTKPNSTGPPFTNMVWI